ncbi:hypothetical protein [Caudoviricetes sp.]|nr:hypothetical protein [Caudoviricetes sp.]
MTRNILLGLILVAVIPMWLTLMLIIFGIFLILLVDCIIDISILNAQIGAEKLGLIIIETEEGLKVYKGSKQLSKLDLVRLKWQHL